MDITQANVIFKRYFKDSLPLDRIEFDLLYSKTRQVWWCLIYRKSDHKPLGKLYLDRHGRPTFTLDDTGRIINEYRKP